MPNTVVVVEDGKKYKVLVNYIQRGVSYNSKELAEQEAGKIRKAFNEVIDSRINGVIGWQPEMKS